MYNEFDDWTSWDDYNDVIYDSLDGLHVDEGAMYCEAFYGAESHISINRGQRQPLDADLWQPADLLEVFHNVSVIHMTEHLEDAVDIMRDATIALDTGLNVLGRSVVCGRLELRFPAIEWDDMLHWFESVK